MPDTQADQTATPAAAGEGVVAAGEGVVAKPVAGFVVVCVQKASKSARVYPLFVLAFWE